MPKPAWYLLDPPTEASPPARTELALRPAADMLAAAQLAGHVGDAVTAGHTPRNPGDLDDLLAGLNCLAAQLAQTLPRLAWHAEHGDLPGLADADPDTVAEATTSLAQAAHHCLLAAGHIKAAYLATHTAQP